MCRHHTRHVLSDLIPTPCLRFTTNCVALLRIGSLFLQSASNARTICAHHKRVGQPNDRRAIQLAHDRTRRSKRVRVSCARQSTCTCFAMNYGGCAAQSAVFRTQTNAPRRGPSNALLWAINAGCLARRHCSCSVIAKRFTPGFVAVVRMRMRCDAFAFARMRSDQLVILYNCAQALY